MGRKRKAGGGSGQRSTFTPERRGRFLAGIRRGETVAVAAAGAEVNPCTAYYWRSHDPAFLADWLAALEASPIAKARSRLTGRVTRKSAGRTPKFTRALKQIFLDHFAATCDLVESARAAGVSKTTIHRHLQLDPVFAEGFEEAVRIGYRMIEANALREVREAQEAYRVAPAEEAAAPPFERAMKLLSHHLRRDGAAGRPLPQKPQPRMRWTFERAIEALEKKLRHFERPSARRWPRKKEELVDGDGGERAPPPPDGRSPSPPNGGEEKSAGDQA